MLVAAAGFLQRLPWVLFGLQAGVLADRHDRRRIVVLVNLARAAVLAVLAASIMTDTVNVAVVLSAMFLLGTAETFADITTGTLLPMIVDHDDLGIANARLGVGHITVNQLAGPPLGALLFAAGMASPFVAQAVFVALGAVLVGKVSLGVAPPATEAQRSMRAEIRDGARWLWHHPPVRTLTLTVLAFNVTFGSTLAILVLYSRERLGLGELGFGLLTTVGALGGILGASTYGRLERRLGPATLMRIGLIVETCTHLTLALTTLPGVAMAILFVFGVHESVWATTVMTIRQKAVPSEFQGRVEQRVPARADGRARGRRRRRWRDRPHLGDHRTVLVRVRRIGRDPRGDLAVAQPDRRPAHGRLSDTSAVSIEPESLGLQLATNPVMRPTAAQATQHVQHDDVAGATTASAPPRNGHEGGVSATCPQWARFARHATARID